MVAGVLVCGRKWRWVVGGFWDQGRQVRVSAVSPDGGNVGVRHLSSGVCNCYSTSYLLFRGRVSSEGLELLRDFEVLSVKSVDLLWVALGSGYDMSLYRTFACQGYDVAVGHDTLWLCEAWSFIPTSGVRIRCKHHPPEKNVQ